MPASKIDKPKFLAQKLIQIRTGMGLTQLKMIKNLGCAGKGIYATTISAYESGRLTPPLTLLLAYARMAGIAVDDLIDDKIEINVDENDVSATRPLEADTTDITSLKLQAIEKESRAFNCPKCKTHLQFIVRVKVMGVHPAESSEEDHPIEIKQSRASDRLDAQQQRLIDQYRKSGLLKAFEDTLRTADEVVPKNLENYLLVWLNNAKPVLVPKLSLQLLVNGLDTPASAIAAYTYQSVTAIITRGNLRCFIPTRMLKGELMAASKGSSLRLRVNADENKVKEWVHVRGAHAIAGSEFLKEIQAGRHMRRTPR